MILKIIWFLKKAIYKRKLKVKKIKLTIMKTKNNGNKKQRLKYKNFQWDIDNNFHLY